MGHEQSSLGSCKPKGKTDDINNGSNNNKLQGRKSLKRPLKLRISDEPYLAAIRNPVFLFPKGADQIEYLQAFPIPIITNQLYISNASGICNIEKLKALGITRVLNVGGLPAAFLPPEAYTEAGIEYKIVEEALDEPSYPMLNHHLEECIDFIDKANEDGSQSRGKGKCVVHCFAGCNRSGVIVAAYYMLSTQTNVLETVLHCRNSRGSAFLTNPGFQRQLVALARREWLLGPAPGNKKCVVDRSLWRQSMASSTRANEREMQKLGR